MQRLIFYGVIVLAVVLLLLLIHAAIYWILRIFFTKAGAKAISLIVLTLMILVIGISCMWGHSHTRLELMVNEVEVPSTRLPYAFEGFRVAQLSDMHLNSFSPEEGHKLLHEVAEAIREQQPDIIVFTGDLVTIRAAEALPFRTALAELAHIERKNGEGSIPVYSILGNHDYADYVRTFDADRRKKDLDSLIQIQEEAGWIMLKNNAIRIQRETGDSTQQQIILAGVENIGEPPFSVYGDLEKSLEPVGGLSATDSLFTILLSHNPTHWRSEVLPRTRIDLTLSGHTHATQILIGSWSPAKWKYAEWMGLYEKNEQKLYVNTGFGCVGPAIRIGIKPELTILTLKKKG